MCLEKEAIEKHGVLAMGFVKNIMSLQLIMTLRIICNLLPKLLMLYKSFQIKQNIILRLVYDYTVCLIHLHSELLFGNTLSNPFSNVII